MKVTMHLLLWPSRGKLDSPSQQHGLPKALPNGRIGISPHNYLWEYKWWPPLVLQCKGHIMDSKDGWMDGWYSSCPHPSHPLISRDHGRGEHLSHPPTRKPFFVGSCHKSLDGGWKRVMESVQFLWLESNPSSCMYLSFGLLKDLGLNKTYGDGCNMKLWQMKSMTGALFFSPRDLSIKTVFIGVDLNLYNTPMYVLRPMQYFIRHNIIRIHNNVLWDWQYATKYSWIFLTFSLNVRMSIPQNIVMDLNNVMEAHGIYIHSSIVDEGALAKTSPLYHWGPNEERGIYRMHSSNMKAMKKYTAWSLLFEVDLTMEFVFETLN